MKNPFRKHKPQRSDMPHTLLDPVFDDKHLGPDALLVKYACSCGTWRRIYRESMAPNLQEVESDHTQHAHTAGADELRTGTITPPSNPLEDMLRAMAKMAEQSVKATETMEEFITAHKEAKDRGMGVVVVRKADGSTTSTPNVFVPSGTAVFMDDPGLFVPSGPLELIPDDILIQRDQYLNGGSYPKPPRTTIETGFAA